MHACIYMQNYRRVAEVWMDEYKEYVYKKRPGSKNVNMGAELRI